MSTRGELPPKSIDGANKHNSRGALSTPPPSRRQLHGSHRASHPRLGLDQVPASPTEALAQNVVEIARRSKHPKFWAALLMTVFVRLTRYLEGSLDPRDSAGGFSKGPLECRGSSIALCRSKGQ